MATIFTQADLDALDMAIATGARKVKYADKEVEYGAMSEVIKARRFVAGKLGLLKPSFATAEFNKGIGHPSYPIDPLFFY